MPVHVLKSAFAAGLLSLALTAAADYPDKPITLVVPYTPGGFTDNLARAVAKPLGERLNQQVVIQNLPGGGGNIAAAKVAKSQPDGYTIYIGNNATITLNSLIYKSLPFDPLKDLAPVGLIGESHAALVVPPSLPVKSFPDLLAYARSKPGELNFGSTGSGGVSHLSGEMLKSVYKLKMTHVPYKGTVPATTDLLGGQLQLMFNDAAYSHIKAEKLRALAVTGTKRLSNFPEIPTLAELGVSGFETYAWFGIFVPSGTPSAIIDKLSKELSLVTQEPGIKAWAQSQNGQMLSSTPQQLAEFIKADLSKWAPIVKETGVVAD
jgi:tripartite-type tricarboxylate transporter receptor subunit TctC